MTDMLTIESAPPAHDRRMFYYGWVNLFVAAFAMVATLPGRTQGLGLVTEPLLRDLHIEHVDFAVFNLWATLIGSTFCLACGPLIDRFGSRTILTVIAIALGVTVVAMSYISTGKGLLAGLIFTGGFGQSALSVVSLTIVGKWFSRRLPMAMALYSVLISIGFIAGFVGVGYAVIHGDWRIVWRWIGVVLVAGLAPLALLLVRRTPESIGLTVDGSSQTPQVAPVIPAGLTLAEALRTAAFWSFALSAAAFGLVSSGLMLFNEAVLTEHGFARNSIMIVLGVITVTALAANFVGGWLADRWPLGRVMGAAMFLLAAALLALPLARGTMALYGYSIAMGLASGLVTVVFFVCWGRVFGRRHLGEVQGAAQLLAVLGSATGPLLLAETTRHSGSSTPLLFALGPVVAVLGVWCIFVPLPKLAVIEPLHMQ